MAKQEKMTFGKEKSIEIGGKYAASLSPEQLLEKNRKMADIMMHPLFTPPPTSVEDSHRFGWMRGMAFLLETFLYGRWHGWLDVIDRGEWEPGDVPANPVTSGQSKGNDAYRMLEKCLYHVNNKGATYRDFIEWIGYGLGISYFDKPRISDELWESLYREFSLDLLLWEKTDVLSTFVAEAGSSGHLDYYPTPIHVTQLMNEMLNPSESDTLYEPCLGAAAMVLPTPSLNIVGIDLNPLMVKVASIQAFLFLPSLLYTPRPIMGLHVSRETMTIDHYFEFDTDTRIYNGDSLLGELRAPRHIFEEGSIIEDIYLAPYDLRLRKVFEWEGETYKPWDSLPDETKIEIVKAFAREVPMQMAMTNPPFDAKLGASAKAYRAELDVTNEAFLAEREVRLAKWKEEAKRLHDLEKEDFAIWFYHPRDSVLDEGSKV